MKKFLLEEVDFLLFFYWIIPLIWLGCLRRYCDRTKMKLLSVVATSCLMAPTILPTRSGGRNLNAPCGRDGGGARYQGQCMCGERINE